MKKLINQIVLVSLIVLTSESCHKPCNEPNYSFMVDESFFPQKDSINVGDTIFILSSFNKELTDTTTKKAIKFSNAENLVTALIISDISKFRDTQRGAIDSFSYFNLVGSIFTPTNTDTLSVKQLTYIETSSTYEIKIALIARKAGIYIFTIPDNPDVFRRNQPKCGTANFEILNRNTQQHLYLFENILGSLSRYDSTHSYCVKVK